MKAIVNARAVLEDRVLEHATVLFDGRFRRIGQDVPTEGCDVVDAGGRYLFPGLIDLHMHGLMGKETLDPDVAAHRFIAAQLPKQGVTGYLPSFGSAPLPKMAAALEAVRACMKQPCGAKAHGAYMEGVFISLEKRGAHDPSLLMPPDTDFMLSFLDVIKVAIAAPELYPEYISWCAERGIVCAMGHTDATYEQAMEGVRRGATQATHLFNGMRGMSHREAGMAGAALLCDAVNVELIADTAHVAKEMFRLVYRLKGPDRILLITDSSPAAGLGPGVYTSSGRRVTVDDLVGRLDNGTISSSVVPLRKGVLNFHLHAGAPLHEAARMATLNPARVLGVDKSLGSIRVGKQADMFLADGDMNVWQTFVDGERVYQA